jgi:hypothetical protein
VTCGRLLTALQVSAAEFVGLEELRRRAADQPHAFTQWFIDEFTSLGAFQEREAAVAEAQ